MTNIMKTVEMEIKLEYPQQSVIQWLSNVTTNASQESTSSGIAKKTVSNDSGTSDVINNVNSSSNESTVKATKDTENLKRQIFEEEEEKEITLKKHKGDQASPSSKDNTSSPKSGSDVGKSGGLGPYSYGRPKEGSETPLLKIETPMTDSDTGIRTNDKNGSQSHHQATLPYVVLSEESPLASNLPNSPKSPQNTSSDNNIVEEQHSPPTRVLNSSNICSGGSSGIPSHVISPTIVSEEQNALSASLASTMVVEGSTNQSVTSRSEQTNNVQVTNSGDFNQTTSEAAADTVKVKYTHLSPTTRLEQTNNVLVTNSGDFNQTTSKAVADTVKVEYTHLSPTTRSKQTENILATNSRDEKPTICSVAATTTMTSNSIATTELTGFELHPRYRKIKAVRTESQTSDTSSVASVIDVDRSPSGTTNEPALPTNSYQMFLNIRKQIEKKRQNLFPVQPKPPSGFKDYLMNRGTYMLAGKFDSRKENAQTPPPANLHEQLKKLFVEQEKERQKLRIQHIVEKEKLVLSVEQEILRVHGRAARALANQELPFSVCTILKDEEVYNVMTPEQEKPKERRVRSRYNGRLFLSWLQELDDKWENIKESMLLRHHNEAESLHAVQKMDWGWKLQELQLCTFSYIDISHINEEHVPMVLVIDDFDLLST